MTATVHASPRLQLTPTPIAGLALVERRVHEDARGWFGRIFCAAELAAAGLETALAQINLSHTRHRGTVRGLHFQHPPHAEAKLVTCVRGEVFDVAVDLRRGSPTLLRWHGETLSAANRRSLYIPHGFAHGFQALSDDCELLYLHSAPHTPGAEGGVHPCDAALGIAWPLAVAGLSARDAAWPPLTAAFEGLALEAR